MGACVGRDAQIDGLFTRAVGLSTVLGGISMPVVIADHRGRVRFFNGAFRLLSGFELSEVRGVPCRHVLRFSGCMEGCLMQRAMRSGVSVSSVGDLINRDRRRVDVRVTMTPVRDASDRILGFVETVEDLRRDEGSGASAPALIGFDRFVGNSLQMQRIFRLIPAVAQTDSSVLITGETGTGKDVLAQVIHEASERCGQAFVKINCGALPETLLESELFGHKKGAFTGATSDKMGRLRLAHRGTLYLTEIGDLSLPLQVKLLTFLDDQIVYALGGTRGFQADVRIIAATHRDLERMVAQGTFRQDLLYRLNVVRFQLPPLRQREGDVELLLRHFLKLYATRFGKQVGGFDPAARALLLSYAYPGNVRELRNIVEYASSICPADTIGLAHLPAYLEDAGAGLEAPPARLQARTADARVSTGAVDGGGDAAHRSDATWAEVERRMIVDALVQAKGRKHTAAELLGWGRTTLWRKMKQYGLEGGGGP